MRYTAYWELNARLEDCDLSKFVIVKFVQIMDNVDWRVYNSGMKISATVVTTCTKASLTLLPLLASTTAPSCTYTGSPTCTIWCPQHWAAHWGRSNEYWLMFRTHAWLISLAKKFVNVCFFQGLHTEEAENAVVCLPDSTTAYLYLWVWPFN